MSIESGKIDVPATIEGVSSKGYTPSAKTLNRLTDLGLKVLAEQQVNQLEELEKHTWKLASTIKDKLIYRKEDFVKALNYLEVFCLYSAEANHESGRNPERETGKNLSVLEAVRLIEHLNNFFETDPKKIDKKVLRPQIKTLLRNVREAFAKNLTLTQQIAMAPAIGKAEKILKKLK